jgi:hypothetical protein
LFLFAVLQAKSISWISTCCCCCCCCNLLHSEEKGKAKS